VSVIVTLRVRGDGSAIEKLAAEDPKVLEDISEVAKEHGVLYHRFYANDDEVLVVDEWPDAGSFQKFFDAQDAQIRGVMDRAGVTTQPEITYWRKLDTKDDVG